MSDILTLERMLSDKTYESVLTLPLPSSPSMELLDEATAMVMEYLRWVTSEFAEEEDVTPDQLRQAIDRASSRLPLAP
jgi:hypothetical protein